MNTSGGEANQVRSSGVSMNEANNGYPIRGELKGSRKINELQPLRAVSPKPSKNEFVNIASKATIKGTSDMAKGAKGPSIDSKEKAMGKRGVQSIGTSLESGNVSIRPGDLGDTSRGHAQAPPNEIQKDHQQVRMPLIMPRIIGEPRIKGLPPIMVYSGDRPDVLDPKHNTKAASDCLKIMQKGRSQLGRATPHLAAVGAGTGQNAGGNSARSYDEMRMDDGLPAAASGLSETQQQGHVVGLSGMNFMSKMENVGSAPMRAADSCAVRNSSARTSGAGPVRKPKHRGKKGKKALRGSKRIQ